VTHRQIITDLYKRNRECHRFLGKDADYQQHFVAFVLPSSDIKFAISSHIRDVFAEEETTTWWDKCYKK
jgi:hypothetical protein